MRWAIWLIAPIAIVLTVVAALRDVKGTYSTSNLAIGLCQSNDDIDPDTREKIAAAAIDFIELFKQSPLEARATMSRRGRAATVDRRPLDAAAAQYLSWEIVSPLEVSDTYFLRFSSGSDAGSHAPCGFRGDSMAFASRGGTNLSAVVLMTEDIPGGSERTTGVWMEHEEGEWRVRAIHFGLSRINGLDSEQLWAQARAHRARGHMLNANMFYVAANGTLDRGSFFQPHMREAFNADQRTFSPPEILRGPPPFQWTFRGEEFVVTQVQYMGFGSGEVVLVIDHTSAAWTTHLEAETINRRLLDGFDEAHSEWRRAFPAIAARASRPGSNETWTTVFRREDGYSATPEAAASRE